MLPKWQQLQWLYAFYCVCSNLKSMVSLQFTMAQASANLRGNFDLIVLIVENAGSLLSAFWLQ